MNESQANPGALEFTLAVQALKDTKKLVGILHIKTDIIIPNVKNLLASQPSIWRPTSTRAI